MSPCRCAKERIEILKQSRSHLQLVNCINETCGVCRHRMSKWLVLCCASCEIIKVPCTSTCWSRRCLLASDDFFVQWVTCKHCHLQAVGNLNCFNSIVSRQLLESETSAVLTLAKFRSAPMKVSGNMLDVFQKLQSRRDLSGKGQTGHRQGATHPDTASTTAPARWTTRDLLALLSLNACCQQC